MSIIYTFPIKSVPVAADLILISDSADKNKTKNTSITSIKDAINVVDSLNALTGAVTLTGGTNITLNTSGNNIVINDDGIGVGTVNKLTKWSATTGRLTDSIITEDTGGPGIQVGGNVAVKSGSYIFTPSILDGAGEFGSANQVLSKSADNSFIEWATASGGSAVGITGSVQYKKSDGSFQGTTDLLFSDDGNGRSTLKVGNNAINQVGELQVEGGDDGPGIIKLNGENKTYYTNISGNDNGTENYTIKLPNSGPTGNNKILESTSIGALSWIDTPSGSVPGGINGSVQFRSVIDGTVTFGGDEDLTYNGSGGLTVGEGGGNGGIITLIAEDGADSGLLKIGHLDNTEYLTLGLGDDAMAASYSIDFPTSAPGGNNKILQSTSAGVLSWIDTPSGSGTVTSLTTTGTSGKATLTSGVLNIPSILIDGFETLPFTTANGYINIKGTYMFQMIAPSNCTPANFKFYSLLGQAAGGTTAVAIYKGALGGVGSLQSTGEITGSYAADQISGSTLTAVEPASDILAGDNIVVCLSFDSNISILGVIPITVSGESILSNASPVSNESLALFDSTTLEASQFPSSIDSLLALLSENTTIKSRPFLLIY
tara:strand:+ start:1999 stop:3801 length:1803 start_codon:yes stop_codon:yes gene_type:complete